MVSGDLIDVQNLGILEDTKNLLQNGFIMYLMFSI